MKMSSIYHVVLKLQMSCVENIGKPEGISVLVVKICPLPFQFLKNQKDTTANGGEVKTEIKPEGSATASKACSVM